jgi:uncharacterized protein (DUF433 family)
MIMVKVGIASTIHSHNSLTRALNTVKYRERSRDAMLTHIPPGLEHIMSIDPEILGREPCFNGTRVPLETVVDNLAAGVSVERILRNYRSLTQEHVDAVLQWEHALAYKAAGLELHAL